MASGVSIDYLQHSLLSLPPAAASNFAPLFRRLHQGMPVQLMAIGSSVTGAAGGCTHGLSPNCPSHCGGECYKIARHGTGWLRRFSDWLARRWPVHSRHRRNHTAYNGGKGATHFEHFAACLDSYLPQGPVHLFVLEATLPPSNAVCHVPHLAEKEADPRLRALAHILNSLRVRAPPPAVLLLRSLCAWDHSSRPQACMASHLEQLSAEHRSVCREWAQG